MNSTRKVAVCQVPDIREDIAAAIGWIEKLADQAEDESISLICFPECFLQGYLTEKRFEITGKGNNEKSNS